jgi:hypothetical protein
MKPIGLRSLGKRQLRLVDSNRYPPQPFVFYYFLYKARQWTVQTAHTPPRSEQYHRIGTIDDLRR